MSDIIVYGSGKTGQSLGELVRNCGSEPIFYDDENGFISEGKFKNGDIALLSPGVKANANGVVAASKAGCKMMCELDYCFPLCKAKCVSVTGTNGKTTICELIRHILQQASIPCRLLGNGGVPFSSQVTSVSENEVVVLESSSFQLNNANNFSPYISVLCNVAPDHLDYHGSFENYLRAKANNFIHQKPSSFSVFNADDSCALQLAEASPACNLTYSVNAPSNCYRQGDFVCLNLFGKSEKVRCNFLNKLVRHNISNVLCAILVCAVLGVDIETGCKALETFRFLPHRLQPVADFNGVTFVDDSKATNVHATVSALQCYENVPLALILGGSDKDCEFDDIFQNLRSNVRLVCAVGQTANKICSTAKKYNTEVKICGDYKDAVEACYVRIKNIGGVVLMSNACASFDMFDGYATRGDFFAKIVGDLIGAQKN